MLAPNPSSAQQTVVSPALGSPISVPQNSATPIWGYVAGARFLTFSWSGGTACVLTVTSGSATSAIIVTAGWDFNPTSDPVPGTGNGFYYSNGNSTPHPNVAGHAYMAKITRERILDILNSY